MSSRQRDYSFEALTEVCGIVIEQITKDERGRVNAALAQLREVEADDYLLADQIHDRANLYRAVYPDAALTPQALANNWSQLPAKHADWRKSQVVLTNVYAQGECEACDGDRLIVYSTRPVEGGVADHVHVYEEFAPCPSCNSGANVGFWRYDGSRFNGPDPGQVRRRIG